MDLEAGPDAEAWCGVLCCSRGCTSTPVKFWNSKILSSSFKSRSVRKSQKVKKRTYLTMFKILNWPLFPKIKAYFWCGSEAWCGVLCCSRGGTWTRVCGRAAARRPAPSAWTPPGNSSSQITFSSTPHCSSYSSSGLFKFSFQYGMWLTVWISECPEVLRIRTGTFFG